MKLFDSQINFVWQLPRLGYVWYGSDDRETGRLLEPLPPFVILIGGGFQTVADLTGRLLKTTTRCLILCLVR